MTEKPISEGWMTYAEAAALLRIKPDSVRRRATARRWPRQTGNDGLARVQVPEDAIPDVTADAGDAPAPALAPDFALVERAVRAEARAEALSAQVEDLRADRDAWRAMAERSWWSRILGRG